jgi:P27 family predicted phage terminase small subunit
MKGRKPSVIVTNAKPVDTVPRAPAWLSTFAKAEWRRIMPLLVERRILTDADMGGVEAYCTACGYVREIETDRRKNGGVIDPKMFRILNTAMQTAKQLAAELGLTPVSRSRPAIREDSDDDDSLLD